jgi:hypothetical protein
MYWVDIVDQSIQRSNLDGTNVEKILSGQEGLFGIGLDPFSEHVYFTNAVDDKIQRIGMDGSDLVDIITTRPWIFLASLQRWYPDRATISFGITAYSPQMHE